MSYNGYENADAFHEAMQAGWREMLDTPEKVAKHNADYAHGHAGCDHTEGYCTQPTHVR